MFSSLDFTIAQNPAQIQGEFIYIGLLHNI